eukprot:351487-Chlamydomonas_euryale.AAC.12
MKPARCGPPGPVAAPRHGDATRKRGMHVSVRGGGWKKAAPAGEAISARRGFAGTPAEPDALPCSPAAASEAHSASVPPPTCGCCGHLRLRQNAVIACVCVWVSVGECGPDLHCFWSTMLCKRPSCFPTSSLAVKLSSNQPVHHQMLPFSLWHCSRAWLMPLLQNTGFR